MFSDQIHTPDLLRTRSAQLLNRIAGGKLKVLIGGEHWLAEVASSRPDRESRKTTTGKLLPNAKMSDQLRVRFPERAAQKLSGRKRP